MECPKLPVLKGTSAHLKVSASTSLGWALEGESQVYLEAIRFLAVSKEPTKLNSLSTFEERRIPDELESE